MKSDGIKNRLAAVGVTPIRNGKSVGLWVDQEAEAESLAWGEAVLTGDPIQSANAVVDYQSQAESKVTRSRARSSTGAQLPEEAVDGIILAMMALEDAGELTGKNFTAQLRDTTRQECAAIDSPEARAFISALNTPGGRLRKKAELYDRVCRHFYDEVLQHFGTIEPAVLDVQPT